MRLLNRGTQELKWFTGEPPPYVVVSHRWHDVETTLQEFTALKSQNTDSWTPGIKKIMNICEHTKDFKQEWIWIDTCCIDKTSSAELQEAINSMYKWYEKAAHCVIYLEDVHFEKTAESTALQSLLESSEWFTRGWTLQELIAPIEAQFYDADWNIIGTRDELGSVISTITGISQECFGNRDKILSKTVAERMSWMSKRSTTRVEDLAYCLLGIFDVAIAMLYGEGEKAFKRLQREIIEDFADETIFLWLRDDAKDTVPMLASSPKDFAACAGHKIELNRFFSREYHTIRRGISIESCARRQEQFYPEQDILLNCLIDGQRPVIKIKAHGKRASNLADHKEWVRLACAEFNTVDPSKYQIPESSYKRYRDHNMQLLREQGSRGRGSAFTGNAMFEYDSEVVSYRVFVL